MFSRDSLKNTKESIQKIYKRIQEGEDFHELAKQYSQDKNTAESGGYVSAFSLGGLNSKTYENKVYELENNGDITEPFQTQFGWHIVKLINTTPLEPYEEVKEEFKKKLKTSNRSKLLVSKIKEDLEKLYKVEINDEAKDYFVEALDSTYAKFKWKYKPSETDSSNYIFQVEGQKVDYNTFGEHLEKKQRSYSGLTSYDAIIDNAIDDLVYSELLSYHKIQLPKVDSEFAERVEEFKDGLLIYDYIQSQVWTPVAKDTVAQKRYYDTHKSEFTTPEQITGQLYTSKSKKALKKVVDRLKNEGENDFQLPDEVIAEDVELETQSKRLPKKLKPELGLTKIYKHSGQFLLLNILEVQKPSIPEFENVKGRVMSILQDEKENELISELRSTYDIFIDEDVLNNLKMEFEN
jgi:peptidyl-prolyl cis-trans isomerase SurA